MAWRQMTKVDELLSSVLSEVARQTGRARQLKPIWDEVVGQTIAQSATPLALEGQRLVVSVAEQRWADELAAREKELVIRLSQKLGKGTVSRLVFRVAA